MLKLLPLILLLSSCVYVREIPSSDGVSLTERIKQSDIIRKERAQEAASYTLLQKHNYFAKRLQQYFIIKPHYLVKRYHVKDADVTTAYLDDASLYLSYLALKGDIKQARKIIGGIYHLDYLNEFDGYLPRYIYLEKDRAKIATEPARTNSYSLLFFSYYLAYNYLDDVEIKKSIREHVALITKYFIKNDLALKNPKGEEIKYSSFKGQFIPSRKLDALVIFEIANQIVVDSELKAEIEKSLAYFYKKKYNKENQKVFLSLGFWEASTPSSNWLNLMKLYILSKATNDEGYQNLFKRVHRQLEKKGNIFYTLLYDDIFPEEKISLANIEQLLNSFPLTLKDHEIINSHVSELRRFPKIIKNRRSTEVKSPLPIYDRPLKYFEWKHTQFRADGNLLHSGAQEFSGVDFLIAYALLQRSQQRKR